MVDGSSLLGPIRNAGLLITLLLSPLSLLQAAERSWAVTAAEWARPRSGEMVLQLPALRGAMSALNAAELSRLTLFYPGGDDGALWVSELKAWLVALGLSGSRIEVLVGSGAPDRIELVVNTVDYD